MTFSPSVSMGECAFARAEYRCRRAVGRSSPALYRLRAQVTNLNRMGRVESSWISGDISPSQRQTTARHNKKMKNLAHRNIPVTIIGGGIHGISIALRLLREIPTTEIAIVDRHPLPLTAWQRKTERQGMTFLRSPAVHHIAPDALGIVEYAERHNRGDELAPPYSQPATRLFWDFCNDVLKEIAKHQDYYQFDVAKLRWDKGARTVPVSSDFNRHCRVSEPMCYPRHRF